MANSQACSFVVDITAAEAIPTNRFVDFSNNVASAAEKSKGVSTNAIGSGETGTIAILGIVEILSGDDFYAGDVVCSGADGKAAAQGGSDPVNGYALEDSSDGEMMQILLK